MEKIVVADRGWVFVGDVTESPNSVVIENAKCIRFWGHDAWSRRIGQRANPRDEN